MNILIVSDLYPESEKQDPLKTTYALHNFAKYWVKDNNIMVIRPAVMKPGNKVSVKCLMRAHKLDNVNIVNVSFNIISKNTRSFLDFDLKQKIKAIIIRVFELLKLDINIPCFLIDFILVRKFLKKSLSVLNNRKFTPDIVVAHMVLCNLLGYTIAKKLKKPLILGIHQSDFNTSRFSILQSNRRHILNYAKAIACRSFAIKKRIVRLFPEFKKKYFIAYSGIIKSLIESEDFFIWKLINWKKTKKIKFITVSRLLPLKNIDIILQSLSEMDLGYQWNYTIVGDGPELKYLKKLTQDLKIKDKVFFTGWKDKSSIFHLLRNTDIFILVSAPETFGLAYLEAMAKGNIVIGTKGWGIDGVIKNNKNGFLCYPRDKHDLSTVLKYIMTHLNQKKLIEIVKGSYKTILNYTEKSASDNYLKQIYKAGDPGKLQS